MKTAVEYLYEQIENKDMGEIPMWVYEFIEQAKEMEKEQIIRSHKNGKLNGFEVVTDGAVNITGEQYYNETYE